MTVMKRAIYTTTAVSLLVAGCAVSPEIESRREAIEADIALILSEPLDPAMMQTELELNSLGNGQRVGE